MLLNILINSFNSINIVELYLVYFFIVSHLFIRYKYYRKSNYIYGLDCVYYKFYEYYDFILVCKLNNRVTKSQLIKNTESILDDKNTLIRYTLGKNREKILDARSSQKILSEKFLDIDYNNIINSSTLSWLMYYDEGKEILYTRANHCILSGMNAVYFVCNAIGNAKKINLPKKRIIPVYSELSCLYSIYKIIQFNTGYYTNTGYNKCITLKPIVIRYKFEITDEKEYSVTSKLNATILNWFFTLSNRDYLNIANVLAYSDEKFTQFNNLSVILTKCKYKNSYDELMHDFQNDKTNYFLMAHGIGILANIFNCFEYFNFFTKKTDIFLSSLPLLSTSIEKVEKFILHNSRWPIYILNFKNKNFMEGFIHIKTDLIDIDKLMSIMKKTCIECNIIDY